METREIRIRVDAEAARIFESVSEEQRRKMEALLSLKLSEVIRSQRTLEEVINNISQKAQVRGLTPEVLDSILSEP